MAQIADLHLRLDAFEGPLPLLLQLIEREQLEVTRVSVVAVADSFLALVSDARETDLATIAEFIAVAARLLVIKSRALLRAPVAAVEETPEPDDAEALARQIAEYRRYQHAARWIGERRAAHALAVPRPPTRVADPAPQPIAVATGALHRAAARLLAPPPIGMRDEEWPQVEYQEVRRSLLAALATSRRCRFADLCAGAWHPLVVITLFLALLESIRARLVLAEQPAPFGEITLTASGAIHEHG